MNQKVRFSTVLIVICCIVGAGLILYPLVSDYWNTNYATSVVLDYNAHVAEMDEDDIEHMWAEAVEYNNDLKNSEEIFELSDEMKERYENCLNVDGSGLMGYVEIPKLEISVPVYHGTGDSVLQTFAGHLEWTSLPTGGTGNHCVISAHRGMVGAKLFTDLDQLAEGDIFTLKVLDRELAYEVDQIRIVEPDELTELVPEPDKDYCTLVTCTPYGINTHRLLVRGHRVEMPGYDVTVASEAVVVDEFLVAVIIAVPFLIVLLIVAIATRPKKNN